MTITIFATIVLLVFEYYITKGIAKIIYNEDKIVPYDQLEVHGVDTNITEAEIDEICIE